MRIAAFLIGCCAALHLPAHAEQVKATYVEIAETYSYDKLTRTRTIPRTFRVWRSGDLRRAELEFISMPSLPPEIDPTSSVRYSCSLPLVIDTSLQVFLINRLNRRGIRIPKTDEFSSVTDTLLRQFTCFGFCLLGDEMEWFARNGSRANNDSGGLAYMLRRGDDQWYLRDGGYGDGSKQTLEYETSSGETVQWDYLVLGKDVPIDTSLFDVPNDIEWLDMPTPLALGMLYSAIGAAPRPEYFLAAGFRLITDDFNFDGHQDFAIYTGSSAKAPYYDHFVYRPADDTFTFQPELSLTANARFDAADKAVYTFHNGGSAGLEYTSDKFTWNGSSFVHISRVRQRYNDDLTFERSYYRIEAGKERLIKQITLDLEAADDHGNFVNHHDEIK